KHPVRAIGCTGVQISPGERMMRADVWLIHHWPVDIDLGCKCLNGASIIAHECLKDAVLPCFHGCREACADGFAHGLQGLLHLLEASLHSQQLDAIEVYATRSVRLLALKA